VTDVDDFSPVVEQGELELASGLLDRLRRRRELMPVGPGSVRVLLDEDGMPIRSAAQLTGGEKRWSRARSWVRVDIGHHTLDYRIAFSDSSGRAGFVATIKVEATICDPAQAVQEGAAGVKGFLEPALARMVGEADGGDGAAADSGNALDALMAMRRNAEAKVRAVRGSVPELPRWLEAKVLSATVAFDGDTQRHHTDLVEAARRGQRVEADRERIEAESINEQTATKGQIAIRKLWRDDLLENLSDPSRRVFEIAFANPTDANIARAVDAANQHEQQMAAGVIEVIQQMIDKNYIDKDDPIYRTVAALGKRLQNVVLRSASPAIAAPDDQEGIDAPARPAEPQAPEEQEGDRDFTDR
jgi:hypothetical protein